MRRAVILLALAYAALYCLAWFGTLYGGSDPAGRGMALGFLSIGAAATALFVIPALILVATDKAPKWALGLALTPAVLVVFVLLGDVI